MMQYFGVSKDLQEKALKDLEGQKVQLEKRGYFLKNEDDEDEEEEEQEDKNKASPATQ